MQIEGQTYEFTMGSDLIRDGMSLECEQVHPNGDRTLLIEAFWHDPTGRFTIHPMVQELPFALMQTFLQKAAERLPPILSTEPGTKVLVYVKLLDKGTEIWRPVPAELTEEGNHILIGTQVSDELWEFESGSTVRCEKRRLPCGILGLVAVESIG